MDHRTLEARLARIRLLCAELESARSASFERYAASPELQTATERRVHAALQSMVTVASLIVAGRAWAMPGSPRDALQNLADRAVVDRELIALKKAVDLRDQLTHDDLTLTPERLHVQLPTVVEDVARFQQQVQSWLEDQTLNEPG